MTSAIDFYEKQQRDKLWLRKGCCYELKTIDWSSHIIRSRSVHSLRNSSGVSNRRLVKICHTRWMLVVNSYFKYQLGLEKMGVYYTCFFFFGGLEQKFLSLLLLCLVFSCYVMKWPCTLWCDWISVKASLRHALFPLWQKKMQDCGGEKVMI